MTTMTGPRYLIVKIDYGTAFCFKYEEGVQVVNALMNAVRWDPQANSTDPHLTTILTDQMDVFVLSEAEYNEERLKNTLLDPQ